MNTRNANLGLITHVENGWMEVKVSLQDKCSACANKSMCTFSGPERAYRTFRMRHIADCKVGDRVLVRMPASITGISLLVMIALPVALLFAGFALRVCCMHFPYATVLLGLVGLLLWIAAMYGVNRWMGRSARFQERVRPVAELLREPGDIAAGDSNSTG